MIKIDLTNLERGTHSVNVLADEYETLKFEFNY